MATLKELYTTLKSLRDMELPIEEKLLKAADELEEKIIKEEILPSLSQNIEPLLNEIQRDLVLVVEYHPDEPINVALSRKVKISEIVDAKPLTPPNGKISRPIVGAGPSVTPPLHKPTKHVENPTKGLRVTFPDGTIIWRRSAIDTFIETLKKIGFDKVNKVGIRHSKYDLVGKQERPSEAGKIWQHECDGWYIYSNIGNCVKIADLQTISEYYKLKLKIDEVKPE